jgi:hypothetical protein
MIMNGERFFSFGCCVVSISIVVVVAFEQLGNSNVVNGFHSILWMV